MHFEGNWPGHMGANLHKCGFGCSVVAQKLYHIPEVQEVEFLPAEWHKNAEGLDPDSGKEWGCLSCIHKQLTSC